MKVEKIILAAGCFWGVQHILDEITGVMRTRCGYTGGQTKNPNYKQVCTGETEHTEAVEIEFDAERVSLDKILDFFWRLHDPTQLNRQGPDVGTQYRSGIYYFTDEQKMTAIYSKAKFDESGVFSKKAVTEILPAGVFYDAEEYHQKYFEKNPNGHICHVLRPR